MRIEILFLVYLIYGLAFFSMGLVLILEARRTSPHLGQRRLLVPLALFGLMHGMHEWLQMFKLQYEEFLPIWANWFRLLWLMFSYGMLWFYGWQAFRVARNNISPLTSFGRITLPLFMLFALFDILTAFFQGDITPLQTTGGLIRYLMAVPGSAIAALGLQASANKARADSRQPLDNHYNWAAGGFALYSVTHLFVPQMNTLAASLINTSIFLELTGFPIQVLRTIAAIIITWNIFRATNFLENERQVRLDKAQKAHLGALEQQEALRRELLHHIVHAQEEERARIARELHDEMAQTLTAFTLDLGTLKQINSPRSKSTPIIARLQELGKKMSRDINQMVYALRPAHLDDLGLLPALQHLADENGPRLGLQIEFIISGEPRRLDSLIETVLFRIAQESMTNIARHAKAERVRLFINYFLDEVELEVSDNGVGFYPEDIFLESRSWGLAGMKERAESAGGRFEVQSEAGRGTTIRVNIPIQPEEL
ncbi:MAG TPA: sensor histidine kinase [Anaerolineales bacterium]|nr:sensor histidine kinase [Methylomicrobium sp.]HRQ22043.1 sensor histidine kinase [Anaerolineales bacterium]